MTVTQAWALARGPARGGIAGRAPSPDRGTRLWFPHPLSPASEGWQPHCYSAYATPNAWPPLEPGNPRGKLTGPSPPVPRLELGPVAGKLGEKKGS